MNSQILEIVRKPLLLEAEVSPNLLSDLAGLEKYIAESYSSRSFIELLQNADDANSSRLYIKRVNEHIIIANDGRKFTAQDFESLCRSAASKKERNTSIGFRGIGFKSVVGFAKRVHIISGELEVTFCRQLTEQIIPKASSVPLIRIPHQLAKDIRFSLANEINNLLDNNYTTIFIFSDLIADFVESEFDGLDPTSLLFLKNVNQIILESLSTSCSYNTRRFEIDEISLGVDLYFKDNKQEWILFNKDNISIAVQKENNKFLKLEGKYAVVHAFLPTSEETGFGFKVNGNISTDPSRLRIIFDDNTLLIIKKIADHYITLIKTCLDVKSKLGATNLIETMVPFFDPRILKLQKNSFQKQLMIAISKSAEGAFDNFYRRPSWLNPFDSEILTSSAKINIPPRDIGEVVGVDPLLKFFEVKEVSLEMLSPSLKESHLTAQGAAEAVSYITKQNSTKQIPVSAIDKDWKIWSVDNKNVSLNTVINNKSTLDIDFIDLVTEKVGISSELNRLVRAVTDTNVAEVILPPPPSQTFIKTIDIISEQKNEAPVTVKTVSLIRWRSAEEQVLEILNSDGWMAKDVSRQNIGYDIEAANPKGEKLFVEVKSIQYEGANFSLTSNEEATAREKGKSYILALVMQKKEQLHVMFIEDPLQVITLERQCKQWVWLCSSYDFKPKIYDFKS
jgi:hypothetical protein